mmetsp:Transcript_19958/g.55481  ORF Transcript_19958/g.55481 Transcript_19958/m.55481 type:complete len:246 (+) Transcript_19958:2-739(+)
MAQPTTAASMFAESGWREVHSHSQLDEDLSPWASVGTRDWTKGIAHLSTLRAGCPSAPRLHLLLAKGLPGQGKSSLCRAVGKALRWPVLDKDDIRGALLDSGMPPDAANQAAYTVLERLVDTQLRMGVSVIVDSPLSCQDTFLSLRDVAEKHGAHVEVVEVQLPDVAEWERRLGQRRGQPEWRRTSSLQQVGALLDKYGGCHHWSERLGEREGLRRVLVDTSQPASEGAQQVIDWLRMQEVQALR